MVSHGETRRPREMRGFIHFRRGTTSIQTCNNHPHKIHKRFLNMFACDMLVAVVALGVSCTLVLAIWLFVLLIGFLVDRTIDLCLDWFDPEVELPPVEPRQCFWLVQDVVEADDVKEDGGSKRPSGNGRLSTIVEDDGEEEDWGYEVRALVAHPGLRRRMSA